MLAMSISYFEMTILASDIIKDVKAIVPASSRIYFEHQH